VIGDGRKIESGTVLETDVCIVGAGPAGIVIALELAKTSLKVCLLESGGFDPELATQSLYKGTLTGQPYFDLDGCRFRLFGGSTNRWGGWCRPLEPIDFERRDWVERSGWPFGAEELAPFYQRCAPLFDLHTDRFDLAFWRGVAPEPELKPEEFGNQVFQYSPETNFGVKFRAPIAAAPGITTLLHANALEIDLATDGNTVSRVRAGSLEGNQFEVKARAFVLAVGGIENPRLLLASQKSRPAGLGNERDWVGRCFMEHPHVPLGHLIPSNPSFRRGFYRKHEYPPHRIRGVLSPLPSLQQRLGLLGSSITIEEARYSFGTTFLEWPSEIMLPLVRTQRWISRHVSPGLAKVLKSNAEYACGLPRQLATALRSRQARRQIPPSLGGARIYSLYFRAEQIPDPASRITLTSRPDRLGMPTAALDWRLRDADTENIWRSLAEFAGALERAGLGRVLIPHGTERERWKERIIGGPHHMGTTRMSVDPAQGVVDPHCRVHSLANLFIAGSSVFPTSGYANPTYTIVALALRLAERLRAVYAR
jgi:choline dehydrogenase-like flavoprotein